MHGHDTEQAEGDPVPLSEVVLPPRAAKAAVPVLATITVGGLVTLLARRPMPVDHETFSRRRDRPTCGAGE